MKIVNSRFFFLNLFWWWVVVTGGFVSSSFAWVTAVDFEPEEGFVINEDVDTFIEWESDGVVIVSDVDSFEGNQSLFLCGREGNAYVQWRPENWSVVGSRVHFAMHLPTFNNRQGYIVCYLGGAFFQLVIGEDGLISIFPLNSEMEFFVEPPVNPLDDLLAVDHWLDLTVVFDDGGEQWALWVNGTLAIEQQPIGTKYLDGFIVYANAMDLFLDAIVVVEGGENIDEINEDNRIVNERGQNGQGSMMDRERSKATVAVGFGSIVPRGFEEGEQVNVSRDIASVLYVNNLSGNDVSADGSVTSPFSSIRAAMAAADNNATIVVQRGTGIYEEGSRSAGGKCLRIVMEESIVIK